MLAKLKLFNKKYDKTNTIEPEIIANEILPITYWKKTSFIDIKFNEVSNTSLLLFPNMTSPTFILVYNMIGIIGGMLIFDAIATIGLFNLKMIAKKSATISWNPHIGSIPEKTPIPNDKELDKLEWFFPLISSSNTENVFFLNRDKMKFLGLI